MWYAYRLENHIIKNYFCLICIRYKHDVIVIIKFTYYVS